MNDKNNPRKAVILLSGGLDSATTLAIAKNDGFLCYALSIQYGQKNRIELESAKKIAQFIGVESHVIFDFNLSQFGGSALTSDIKVPKSRSQEEIGEGIPITYVPARNTLFLSLALSFAESINATDIFIGANAVDYSGYPDCRPEFIKAFETVANLGTKAGIEGHPFSIQTPLIHLSKSQIIQKGLALGLDYSLTWSCYDPDHEGFPCGQCDSCILRKKGFKEANSKDPLKYKDVK